MTMGPWSAGGAVRGGETREDAQAEAAEVAQVEKMASRAGLGTFHRATTAHYLAMGDAPASFEREALRQCEPMAGEFLDHFRGRGFEAAFPDRRLTVITLKDQDSYAALLGEAPGKSVGGHYDLGSNRLVIFDFRPGSGLPEAQAERVNLFTLVHETAHQLSFNTGIFRRQADIPLCILEGLATYAELWRLNAKNAIGGVNRPRLEALRDAQDWIAIPDLIADDRAFEPESEQLAYAESWLLFHGLMTTRARLPRLCEYLGRMNVAKKSDDRLAIAEKSLGPLKTLDGEIKRSARKYLR
jgi:hypothetical protein